MTADETIAGTLRRAVGTRGRRVLLLVTVGVGVLAALALMAGLPPAERTVATFGEPVHSFISVPLPFVGVLIASDLRRTAGARVLPTLAGATLIAVAVGLVGDAIVLAASAASGSTAPEPWANVGRIAVAGVLVQVLAQLVGTGLGLLFARPVWGCPATIVLPLGAYALLTPLGTTRDWLTPYGAMRHVLGGAGWPRWAIAALLWGVVLNAAGVVVSRRRAGRARPGERHGVPAFGAALGDRPDRPGEDLPIDGARW
ncbi:hypothetical protein [Micromonospora humi]|uniref:Uncharacterized protein n=1 Tax=Micromonospora humi TaxID=745366 RepID=A0A1C5GLE3_9ACTN|nr:hypothetical protein [Micromonospora humi]SCG33931.1 hypothetical protein GA0070213_10180 [Micromonospora humi]